MRVWDIAQAQTDIQSDMQSYISSQTDLLANYRLNEVPVIQQTITPAMVIPARYPVE